MTFPDGVSPLARPSIEAVWLAAARACGWEIERSGAAFASADGRGRILIGEETILDRDDAVAQLIFHELCHALVQGPGAWRQRDWGLDNADDEDVVAEHACLRVQVRLSAPHGLRRLMAPTTEYRAYHDALGDDPLSPASDAAAARAAAALERSETLSMVALLTDALAATRAVLNADPDVAAPELEPRHPTGFAYAAGQETCATCAWLYLGGRGPAVARCRQSAGPDGNGLRTEGSYRACVRWEAAVDCQTCGACCREAYHSVTISVRDPVVWKQPDLIARHGHRFEIRREGPRCAALEDRRSAPIAGQPTFSCSIYEDRPRACRDFEAGGRHCLVARRRVGLSP